MEYTVPELASKCRSKTEFYNILSRDGNIYLPPSQDANQKYLRSIMTGRKNYITWDRVNVIKVPQYEGLTVKQILAFAQQHAEIQTYLLEYQYDKIPNREWVWNVVNSLIPQEFKEFIDKKVKERKQNIIKSQNLGANIMPQFVNIFKTSNSVSLHKGKSHFLIRQPQKTKLQAKLEKIEEEKSNSDKRMSVCIRKLDELCAKIKELEEKQIDYDDNINKLSKLYQLGLIDEEGNPMNKNAN